MNKNIGNNNNNNNNQYEIPSVAPTPVSDPFMFEVADQIILEKDKVIALLKEELAEIKEFMSEQRGQKINRDAFIRALTSVVEDVVALYPSFKNKTVLVPDIETRAISGMVRGYDWVKMMVDFIDKYKRSLKILRWLQTELLQIKIENASYEQYDPIRGYMHESAGITCKTRCSIDGIVSTGFAAHPFSMLKNIMEGIIIELIKLGKEDSVNHVWYKHGEAKDGIHYHSNEEHAQIWEHKKAFSRRLVNATVAYVESLIQTHC
jgi:hypothetical protein